MFHVELGRSLREYFVHSAAGLDIELSAEAIEKFSIYLNELISWNKKINLTAVTDKKEILVKHFLDSLMGGKAIDQEMNSLILDVGSGAGFPGIPLRIFRGSLNLLLIEPNKKKVAFLRHILGCLHLSGVTAFQGTFDDFLNERTRSNTIGWIVSRALNVERILTQFHSALGINGRIMLYRTMPYTENSNVSLQIDREIHYQLPHGFGERVLTILKVPDAVYQTVNPLTLMATHE